MEKILLHRLASQVMSVTVLDHQPGRREPKQKLSHGKELWAGGQEARLDPGPAVYLLPPGPAVNV